MTIEEIKKKYGDQNSPQGKWYIHCGDCPCLEEGNEDYCPSECNVDGCCDGLVVAWAAIYNWDHKDDHAYANLLRLRINNFAVPPNPIPVVRYRNDADGYLQGYWDALVKIFNINEEELEANEEDVKDG